MFVQFIFFFFFYGNIQNLPWSFEKTADRHVCIETFNKGSGGFFWKYFSNPKFFHKNSENSG